jgi:hypothetical protein
MKAQNYAEQFLHRHDILPFMREPVCSPCRLYRKMKQSVAESHQDRLTLVQLLAIE